MNEIISIIYNSMGKKTHVNLAVIFEDAWMSGCFIHSLVLQIMIDLLLLNSQLGLDIGDWAGTRKKVPDLMQLSFTWVEGSCLDHSQMAKEWFSFSISFSHAHKNKKVDDSVGNRKMVVLLLVQYLIAMAKICLLVGLWHRLAYFQSKL
jgi:hypothetical protein